MSTTTPFYPGGPGYLTVGGAQYQMRDDWDASHEPTQFKISTNLQGEDVDEREENMMAKISATPIGVWGATAISQLYAYAASAYGSLIFPTNPATDQPLVIQTTLGGAAGTPGTSITYGKAALTKMPDLIFSTKKTLFGAAEWTCLRPGGGVTDVAGSFCAVANSAYVEPNLYPQLILTAGYTLNFGGLTGIDTVDGVTFTPTLSLENVESDLYGLSNMRIRNVEGIVKFKPKGLTESQLLANLQPLDGPNTGRGSSLSNIGGLLTCTSAVVGGPILTMPLAAVVKGGLRFSLKDDRVSEITVRGLRANVGGVLQPRWTVTTH